MSYLVYADTSGCCVIIYTLYVYYNNTTARRTGIYQIRHTAYKVAPDDGLTQPETCRAYSENKV